MDFEGTIEVLRTSKTDFTCDSLIVPVLFAKELNRAQHFDALPIRPRRHPVRLYERDPDETVAAFELHGQRVKVRTLANRAPENHGGQHRFLRLPTPRGHSTFAECFGYAPRLGLIEQDIKNGLRHRKAPRVRTVGR